MKILLKYFAKPRPMVKILVILIFFLHHSYGHSQNGWQENRFYAYRGGSDIICTPSYILQNTDGFVWWTETWKKCRKRIWHQEFYSGFIYHWGPNGWYREWKEGNFWYFNWYDYPVRVR